MYRSLGACDHHATRAPLRKWLEARTVDQRGIGLRPIRFCPDCGEPINSKKVWPVSLIYHTAASKALAANGITQKAPRRVIHQALNVLDDSNLRTEEERAAVYLDAFRHTAISQTELIEALQIVTAL
jgi:hypothetical protein